MCRSKKNESSYNEDLEKVAANVNDLKTNLGSLAASFFAEDGPFFEWQDRAKSLSTGVMDEAWKLVNDVRGEVQSLLEDDAFFPKPYQTRLGKEEAIERNDRWGWGGWHSRWRGQTPFGFYSYQAPTSRYYHDCLQKNGESVWDSEGYWRCLFPNAEVPNLILAKKNSNQILTKEDFNNAAAHANVQDGVYDLGAKGTYFKQFTDYLNWKEAMYENVRREKENRRNQLADQLADQPADQQWHEQWHEKHTHCSPHKRWHQRWHEKHQPQAVETQEKQVQKPEQDTGIVAYSVLNVFNSSNEGNYLSETRTERFKDGSTRTTTTTKRKPVDSLDWITVEDKTDYNGNNTNSLAAQNDTQSNSGWFWR
jgi:hypothetical protein